MRIALLLLSATLLLTSLAPAARAHGGQFRGPGGSLPPNLRPPHDPTPPPPPGVPPSDPTPRDPSPGDPGDRTPPGGSLPPGGTTPPSVALPGGGGGRRSLLTYESWMYWYEHNREGIEELKDSIYSLGGTTNPIGIVGGGGREPMPAEDGARQGTASVVRTRVIPTLLWALDPKNAGDPDVEGSAAIALAKVTQDPQHVDLLIAMLTTEHGRAREELARESAALALGLLRRAQSGRQLAANELDRARQALFDVLTDDKHFSTRTRGFAAVALGLLGDQPTGSAGVDAPEAARVTTRRLIDLLVKPHADDTLPVALLLGLGLQPAASFGASEREVVLQAAVRSRLGGADVSPLVRAHAALALGRMGDVSVLPQLQALLTGRSVDVYTRRSAAIGLGRLGRLLPRERRAELARNLREALERSGDVTTKDFGLMSLAYLLTQELGERATDTLEGAGVGAYLLKVVSEDRPAYRTFAALALGWVLRAMGDEAPTQAHVTLRQDALEALRAGLASKAMDPRDRAAFAVALGMARDVSQRKALLALATNPQEEVTLRGYAAVGIGLIGVAGSEVVKALRGLLEERSSEDLTQQAATALGLAQDRGAVGLLLAAYRAASSTHARTQIMLALARIGDARAVDPLEQAVKDRDLSAGVRALACASLGVVGDLEPIPSMARLTRDLNYRAANELVSELVSIL